MKKEIIKYIGKATYQKIDHLGNFIYANRNDNTREIIGVIYGYNTDIVKEKGKAEAKLFQDEIYNFVVDAINEKIERDKLINPMLIEDEGIENYNLSVRLVNCLKSIDIHYPIELTTLKRNDLRKYKNFGKVTEFQLDKFMEEYGIKFLGE
jgi:DNA-directed RNA polymerase alpha subunit